uniref:sorting nexin-25-like n=1 Tax=Styela clava TaxID=7725 RepID=UPI00193A582F|nr:sorting nexin-25-like [Styela clava]
MDVLRKLKFFTVFSNWRKLTLILLILWIVYMFDTAIPSKVFNMVSAIVAALIGILTGIYIAIKTVDYAVDKYPWSQNQNGILRNRTYYDIPTGEGFIFHIKKFFVVLLKGLSKSIHMHYRMHETPRTSLRHIQTKIAMLGKIPDRSSVQSGTYVCVSQNVDMLMNRIFEYTFRDFVETWYATVSNDHGRLHKLVKADFWEAYRYFSKHLSKVDITHLVMDRFVKTLVQYFKELSASDPSRKNAELFSLHPCLYDTNSEKEFLRRISGYIIKLCFPIHISSNSSSKLILREILAGLVFLPMIDSICDPDYINLSILAYIKHRESEQEEKTRAYMYAATYEDFIRIISSTDNINQLYQIRRHIMTELMHATAISSLKKNEKKLGKAKSMAKGELLISRDLKRYINQCQVARQQCEKRIKALGGDGNSNQPKFGDEASGAAITSSVHLLSYSEVMASPMARSYFMKYMKKIGRGSLLKFWSEVEIIRDTEPTGKNLAKIISHIYQTYVVPGTSDELGIDIEKSLLKGMQTCVVGNKAPDDFFTLQEQIYKILEKDHFPSFLVSDFYIYQLMPQLRDDSTSEDAIFQPEQDDSYSHRTAAFGNRKSPSDGAIEKLRNIEEKLEYKAQALESLKPGGKQDQKLTKQLQQDIADLQKDKLQQQLHIERTETWWSRMGNWSANIDNAAILPINDENAAKVPVYSIIVLCSGVPLLEVTDDVSGWVVARNLDEFKLLHRSLRDLRPWLKKKRLPNIPMFGGISDKFLDKSKVVLNEYLKDILEDEILSRSELVYAFLSQPPEQSKNDSLLRGKSHRRNTSNPLFSTGETSRKKSLWQIGDLLFTLPKDIFESVLRSEDDLSDSDETDADDVIDLDSIAEPLYELVGEIFEIQGLFRPLRKTLVIFVRLAFGGTINKQIKDTLHWLISDPMLTYYLQLFMDSMWPDGQLKPKLTSSRSEEEKTQTALEAQVKLLQNIPEAFQSLIGQENARRGILKIFHALQDEKLNKHIFYNLLCEMVEEVFPDIIST